MANSVVEASRSVTKFNKGNKGNVGIVERVFSGISGAGMTAYGLYRRSPGALAMAAGGGYLLFRGATGYCPVYEAAGIKTTARPKARTAENTVTIDVSPERLYRFWRNLENLPLFMENLESVKVDGRRSHWVAKGPMGARVEWDAEITEDRENELIAWRSVEGSDVETEGEVHFKPAPRGRGTEVKVVSHYRIPAGKALEALAWVAGKEPRQQIAHELRRLKQLIETGEIPTIKGQPSGRKLLQRIPPGKQIAHEARQRGEQLSQAQ